MNKHYVYKIPTMGYIYISCARLHMWEENIRYKGVSSMLNGFGESRMYPT